MTEFLHSLFGGSDAQSTQSSTPSNVTDQSLQGLGQPLAASLQQLLSQFQGTVQSGPQSTTQAPVTGQEQGLLDTINKQVGPGTDSAGYIKNVLQGQYMPGNAQQNPFLAQAITAAQRPTLDNLTQTLTRDLPGRFAAAGQQLQANSPGGTGGGSSAFDRAAALAFQSAANTSTDIASNIGNNAYNTGIQQQENAAGLDQQQVDKTISALQASALPRLIQQNGLDQGLQLFQQQTQSLLDILKTIGAVQAPTIANSSTGQSTATKDSGIVPSLFPKGI